MSNPFLRRMAKRSTGSHGVRSEKLVNKRLGARPTPGSGAMDIKGDGVLPSYLVEHKSTKRDSFSLKRAHLTKITEQALSMNRTPLFTISFVRPDGWPDHYYGGQWAMIPLKVFEELTSVDVRKKNSRTK